MPGGVYTRWGWFIDVAVWLEPAGERFELILTFLLHSWLAAEGKGGLGPGEA